MIFANPTTDMVFKKLFGVAGTEAIVINFLNSVLERTKGEKIVEVTFIDPSNHSQSKLDKTTIIDVRCTDEHNKQFIVTLQLSDQADYLTKSQFYSALALSQQLRKGSTYSTIIPVIFVGVLNFNLFPQANYLSHHVLVETQTHQQSLTNLEFHFVELKKFTLEQEDLKSVVDKWIYLLKHAHEMQTIPSSFKTPHELTNAMELLDQGTWTAKELTAYERILDAERFAKSIEESAIEKGMAQGREEGAKEAARTIARQLLQTMAPGEVAKITSMPIDEIKQLQ